jgi:3-phenylpropionate/trans-cinnamate dioxygenase ferredoxin subunit
VPEHRVTGAGKLPCGQLQRTVLGDVPVCLVRSDDGAFFAVSDVCSHEQTPLSDGWAYDHLIECALHGAVFDLETGEAVALPATEPIATYPVAVDGEDLLIDVPPPDGAGA